MFDLFFALNTGLAFERLWLWQVVTYIFLHIEFWHLFFNMLALYFLGCEMERTIGTARFLSLYLLSGVLGGLGWMVTGNGMCIGASGAVFGILGAFAAMFPRRQITLLIFFIIPVTVTARTLVITLGIISLLLTIQNNPGAGGIAHMAHLSGGVAGYLYGLWLARRMLYYNPYTEYTVEDRVSRAWDGLQSGIGRRISGVFRRTPPSRQEVDRVLDKMLEKGYHKLSWRERRILTRASKRR